jgi:hypothetical protein
MQVAGFTGSAYEDLLTLQHPQAKPTRALHHAGLFLFAFLSAQTTTPTLGNQQYHPRPSSSPKFLLQQLHALLTFQGFGSKIRKEANK